MQMTFSMNSNNWWWQTTGRSLHAAGWMTWHKPLGRGDLLRTPRLFYFRISTEKRPWAIMAFFCWQEEHVLPGLGNIQKIDPRGKPDPRLSGDPGWCRDARNGAEQAHRKISCFSIWECGRRLEMGAVLLPRRRPARCFPHPGGGGGNPEQWPDQVL